MFDFSKISAETLTGKYILSKISDAQIFRHYFGEFSTKKCYSSIFRKDRTPSTGFYISPRTGGLIYNDIKTGEKLGCFHFVAKLYNLNYYEAVNKVAADFGIIQGQNNDKIKRIELLDIDPEAEKETIIQFVPKKFTVDDLKWWRLYEINEDELKNNEVYAVQELFINKKKIKRNDSELQFAYIQEHDGRVFTKIYTPQSKDMKWITNIPLSVPFDYEKLKYNSNLVIITKSKKDKIVLSKYFSDVFATQNESEAALPKSLQENLLNNFDRRIINFDNDETGIKNCKKFNEKGFGYFNIPYKEYERFKIKDASDYVRYYGVDALEELLKTKNLI